MVFVLLAMAVSCTAMENLTTVPDAPYQLEKEYNFYFDQYIGQGQIHIQYKVHYVSESGTYLYLYTIEHETLISEKGYYDPLTPWDGSSAALFSWTILDRVLGGGNVAQLMFLPLGQMKKYTFGIESKEAPVWAEGKAKIFSRFNHEPSHDSVFKDRGVHFSPAEIYVPRPLLGFGNGMIPAPLPPSFVNPKFSVGDDFGISVPYEIPL